MYVETSLQADHKISRKLWSKGRQLILVVKLILCWPTKDYDGCCNLTTKHFGSISAFFPIRDAKFVNSLIPYDMFFVEIFPRQPILSSQAPCHWSSLHFVSSFRYCQLPIGVLEATLAFEDAEFTKPLLANIELLDLSKLLHGFVKAVT